MRNLHFNALLATAIIIFIIIVIVIIIIIINDLIIYIRRKTPRILCCLSNSSLIQTSPPHSPPPLNCFGLHHHRLLYNPTKLGSKCCRNSQLPWFHFLFLPSRNLVLDQDNTIPDKFEFSHHLFTE